MTSENTGVARLTAEMASAVTTWLTMIPSTNVFSCVTTDDSTEAMKNTRSAWLMTNEFRSPILVSVFIMFYQFCQYVSVRLCQ